MNKKKSLMLLLCSVPVSACFASIYSNQKIAAILDYQPALFGSIGLVGIGKVQGYLPFSWIGWYFKFGSQKGADSIFMEYGFEPLYMGVLIGFMIAAIIVARNREQESDIHGTAHFATKEEIYEFGHFPDNRPLWEVIGNAIGKVFGLIKGVIFGGEHGRIGAVKDFFKWLCSSSRKANDNDLMSGKGVFLGYLDDNTYLRDNAKTHTLLIAPTRSGKGVGHIIPTLLTWEGSTVVTDVKGENWELTSGYRKSQLNNDVFMFKPTSMESCHYNPLGEIRIGTTYEMGDLQLITKILVDPTGKGSEGENAHWVDNAWQLLQGVVLHLLYQKKYHNYIINENGDSVHTAGRIANLSDVLDYLYDDQDESDNIMERHKEFINNKRDKEKKSEVEEFNAGLSGMNVFANDLDEIAASTELDEAKDVKPAESESGQNAEQSINENPSDNSAAGPKDLDGNPIDLEQEAKEDAGIKGLQAKLKRCITNYRLKERVLSDGTREDYVVPFCHAPIDDPDLFTRLYPDKVSRAGLHPHVRQIFQAMIDKPDKEFGSILSTLDTALIIYRNPVLVANTSESDFVMKDLMDCKKPISLYLVFGPGEIDVVRPLCRVIVEMMWRLNVEEMKFSGGKMLEHKHRLLMLLDEFPALGKMGGIEQSEGFLAGYGIKLMIIAQDINQINSLYGKDNYVISNCQVQIYHAPSDNNSAKYLFDKLGTKTVKQSSFNRNSMIFNSPNSITDSFSSRPLMYADEISRMSDKKLLLFCKGLAPIMCNKIRYYEDEIFAPRVKIKAPAKSDKIDNDKRIWDYSEYALLQQDKDIDFYDEEKLIEADVLSPEILHKWIGDDGESEEISVDVVKQWLA